MVEGSAMVEWSVIVEGSMAVAGATVGVWRRQERCVVVEGGGRMGRNFHGAVVGIWWVFYTGCGEFRIRWVF